MRPALVLSLALLGLVPGTAKASYSPIPFDEMIDTSHVIVIGVVEQIHQIDRWQVAEILIEETFKGPVGLERIQFIASPTWSCDTSHAELNERVLLFLNKQEGFPRYQIANAGRGRFRFYTSPQVIDKTFVKINRVPLPQSLEDERGEWRRFNGILDLEHVLAHLRARLPKVAPSGLEQDRTFLFLLALLGAGALLLFALSLGRR